MKVTTQKGVWVVPQQRGVWIPARTEHQIESAPVAGLPAECGVVGVSPLLRELILTAADAPQPYDLYGQDGRVMELILDEIRSLPVVPLHLPEPTDSRRTPARWKPGDGMPGPAPGPWPSCFQRRPECHFGIGNGRPGFWTG